VQLKPSWAPEPVQLAKVQGFSFCPLTETHLLPVRQSLSSPQ
jgi:hypothetical protein